MAEEVKTGSWWSRRGLFSKMAIIFVGVFVAVTLLSDGDDNETVDTTTTESTLAEETETDAPLATQQAYMDEMQPLLLQIVEVSITQSQLSGSYLGWSEVERLRLAAALATLQTVNDRAHDIDPPDHLKESHEALLSATEKMAQASKLTAKGIDDKDGSLIKQAMAKMVSSDEDIDRASTLLDEAKR